MASDAVDKDNGAEHFMQRSRLGGVSVRQMAQIIRPSQDGRIIRALGAISRLEFEFCAHQHCPAVGNEWRSIFAERRLCHSGLRALEIIVVPHIDEVRSELEPQALSDRESFHHTEVPILKPWPSKGVAAEISPARHAIRQRKTISSEGRYSYSGSIDRHRECPQIMRDGILDEDAIRVEVRSGGCRRPDARAVGSGSESERLSRFEFDNAGQLPAPKHLP